MSEYGLPDFETFREESDSDGTRTVLQSSWQACLNPAHGKREIRVFLKNKYIFDNSAKQFWPLMLSQSYSILLRN